MKVVGAYEIMNNAHMMMIIFFTSIVIMRYNQIIYFKRLGTKYLVAYADKHVVDG